MYNSRLSAANVAKLSKVLLVMLSLILGYNMMPKFTTSAFASVPTHVVMPGTLNDANSLAISTEQSKPKKAGFLEIVDRKSVV